MYSVGVPGFHRYRSYLFPKNLKYSFPPILPMKTRNSNGILVIVNCHYQHRHVCCLSLSNLGLTHLSLLKKQIRTKYDCVSYRHLMQILTRFFLPGSWSEYDNHYRPSIASKGHYPQISMWRKADTFSLRHEFDCQLRVCTVFLGSQIFLIPIYLRSSTSLFLLLFF